MMLDVLFCVVHIRGLLKNEAADYFIILIKICVLFHVHTLQGVILKCVCSYLRKYFMMFYVCRKM